MLAMQSVLVLMALTVNGLAQAEPPVFLACSGEMRDPAHSTSEFVRAIIIAVSLEARTLTVLGYDPVAIISEAADGTVAFGSTERGVVNGVTAGKINRITGLTSIDLKTNDDFHIFDGTCKRAEKLF
jgi:hypothetical protein